MPRSRNLKKGTRPRGERLLVRAALLVPIVLVLALAVGCSTRKTNPPQIRNDDPLLGVPVQSGQEQSISKSVPKTNTGKLTKNEVPPFPKKTYTLSTAALAAGTTLDNRRPTLIIPMANKQPADRNRPANTEGNGNSPWTIEGNAPNKSVVLQHPTPVASTKQNQTSKKIDTKARPVPVVPNRAPARSFAELENELLKHNIALGKQEKVQGGIKLSYVVTNPQNPERIRFQHVTAPTAVQAAQMILRQATSR